MTKRLNRVLLALILLFGIPFYWLLVDNRPGDVQPKPVSIEQLRQLAASKAGSAPSSVEVELVTFRRLPGNFFAAGTGFKRRLIGVMAWRLPVAGARPIMIDSGMNAASATEMGMEQFDRKAWNRVQFALDEASQIIITHEHADHLGGVVNLGNGDLLGKVRFNPNQLPGNRWTDMLSWPKGPLPQPTVSGTQPLAVAPGVVIIPAPSHTPGSQMVFVRLADGREFLFTGDIATLAQNWQEQRARSRLIGDYLAPENRAEVFTWLRTIKALKQAAPALVILPGHDFEWIVNPENKAGVKEGFSASAV